MKSIQTTHRTLFFILAAAFCALCATVATAREERPKLLFLVVHGFNRMEHFEALYSFIGLGYDVDVASFERGVVLLDPRNERVDNQGRDAYANLAMREVTDISSYMGLVIPGGYSAGNMEDDPEAIRIVRAFDQAGKPIGSICHAARLLAGAGIAAGRVVTGWNEIPSEVPERWVRGDLGIYIDQEVVVDGNIISCRYPNDMGPWFRVFAQHLYQRGGIAPGQMRADAVFIASSKQTGHLRQMTTLGARNNNVNPVIIHNPGSLAGALQRDLNADVVFLYPDAECEAMLQSADGQALLAALGNPPVHRIAANSSQVQLREAVAVALQVGHPLPETAPVVYDAVIALSPGFDDRVVIAMDAFLRYMGFNPVHVAHETGWVRGLKGLPVFASATYHEPPKLRDRVLVVAPGGLWPREDPNARQADQPDWIRGQAARDAQRAAWITERYTEGGVLVTFGFDSLYITTDEVFRGIPFAASDQTVWSFRTQSAADYAPNVQALRSAERIFSARGFEALPELIQMLQQPAAAALLNP